MRTRTGATVQCVWQWKCAGLWTLCSLNMTKQERRERQREGGGDWRDAHWHGARTSSCRRAPCHGQDSCQKGFPRIHVYSHTHTHTLLHTARTHASHSCRRSFTAEQEEENLWDCRKKEKVWGRQTLESVFILHYTIIFIDIWNLFYRGSNKISLFILFTHNIKKLNN